MKLSKTQREFLARLQQFGAQKTARNYSTARVLRDRGLITIEDVPPPYGWRVTITDEGAKTPTAEPAR